MFNLEIVWFHGFWGFSGNFWAESDPEMFFGRKDNLGAVLVWRKPGEHFSVKASESSKPKGETK